MSSHSDLTWSHFNLKKRPLDVAMAALALSLAVVEVAEAPPRRHCVFVTAGEQKCCVLHYCAHARIR